VPSLNLKDSVLSEDASLRGIAYENDKGPTGVNQLTATPVDDLILLLSKELS
jgi:hypothetical protein